MSESVLINSQNLDNPKQILGHFSSGQLLKLDASPDSVLIICHRHHAEIVGSGAAVGSILDLDTHQVIPLGEVSFSVPNSFQERQEAYLKRQEWLATNQEIVQEPVPLKRAVMIMLKLTQYCGVEAVQKLPDEVLAKLAGVLPKTVMMARQSMPQRSTPSLTKTEHSPVLCSNV